MDSKSSERDDPGSFGGNDQDPEAVRQVAAEQEFHEAAATGLAFEPVRLIAAEDTRTGDGADEILRQLVTFFFSRAQVADANSEAADALPRPALLYQYRDLSRIRHDYPACLNEADTDRAVRSLTDVIDELLATIADDSDAGQAMKQHIYRLEAEIRTLAASGHDAGLRGLWERAGKNLLASAKLPGEKNKILEENLDTARRALTLEFETIACGADVPVRLLSTSMLSHWLQGCKHWREQLELLIRQLQDILRVDFDHSAAAKSPQHLREATSTDDIDFDAMASILVTGHAASRSDPGRSQRIRTCLEILQRLQPMFTPLTATGAADAALPFSVRAIFNDCGSAVDEYQARMRTMTEFFRAVSIAKLEVQNRYRDALHDEFFDHFDNSQLSADELALCPPVLLALTSDSLTPTGIAGLLEILSAGLPIKILLVIEDLYKYKQTVDQTSLVIDWPARLANMVMALDQVYVLQSPVSRPVFVHRGMLDGLAYAGPALFSIYAGRIEKRSSLPVYLDAAAALESRAFPLFSYNPGKGQTQAQRMDVSGNSDCEREWPLESFRYRRADDNEASLELAFTPADFLLCDRRFAAQFRYVTVQQWHENMLPLQDYLALDAQAAEMRVPYLLTVDKEGRLGRVIMTWSMVELVRQCASFWHNLQELGGINNSFALKLLAAEKDRLATAMQQQINAIETRYSAQLDQDIGKLTAEIVQRIADQLVSNADAGADIPMRTPPTASVRSTPLPAAAVQNATGVDAVAAEKEEEEEIGALDEPYIETPRCTSCDDCTRLNGQLFGYDENKQAFIKDATAGPYKDMVRAAELCPVKIIHPGKPKNPAEPGLDALLQRAAPFM